MTILPGDQLPTLTGERVRLRWIVPSDDAALFEIFSNAEVMRYWSCPPFETPAEGTRLREKIEREFKEQTLFQWGVALRETDQIVGTCTLFSIDMANGRAEIGYALGRNHWGRGLMREVLALLIGFAFETLKLRRLEADTDPRNAASIRSLENCGFKREGLLRERWRVNGETQGTVFFGLLEREWRRTA